MASKQEAYDLYYQAIESGDTARADAIAERILESKNPLPSVQIPDEKPIEPYKSEGDGFLKDTADVGMEFMDSANRAALGGLDFLTTDPFNAVSQLVGSDYRIPSIESLYTGGPGRFSMDEGLGRDIVRGAGTLAPAAVSMVPQAGRNIGSAGGAAAELLGLGTGTPASQMAATARLFTEPSVPMAQRADDLGWPISPGERAGSETLKRIESSIESTPMPLNPMHRQSAKRQQMINDAAAQSVGLPAGTSMTSDVVGDTAEDIAQVFKDLEVADDLPVDNEFVESLLRTQDQSKTRLFKDPVIAKVVDDVFDRVDGSAKLKASDYQDMTSELKAKIRQAWKGESPDPYFAESLGQIVDALDKVAESGMTGLAMAQLKAARRKWKALVALEKSRAVKESGDISGPLLANWLRRNDKAGYLRGRDTGQLYETARMSKAFPPRPNSGTAERLQIGDMLNHPLSSAARLAAGPFLSTAANTYMASPQAARGLFEASPLSLPAARGIQALFDDEEE